MKTTFLTLIVLMFIAACTAGGGRTMSVGGGIPALVDETACETISADVTAQSAKLNALNAAVLPSDYCNIVEKYASVKIALDAYLAGDQKNCGSVIVLKNQFNGTVMNDKLVGNQILMSTAPFYTRTLFHIQDSNTGHGYPLPGAAEVLSHMISTFPTYYNSAVLVGGVRDQIFNPLYRCNQDVPLDLAANLFANSMVKYLMVSSAGVNAPLQLAIVGMNTCSQSHMAALIKAAVLSTSGTDKNLSTDIDLPPYSLQQLGTCAMETQQLQVLFTQ